MRIYNKSIKLEICREDIVFVEPYDKLSYYDDYPIYVERVENDEYITWYGVSVNYRYLKKENKWVNCQTELDCEAPSYEEIYLKLLNS